ncbi:5-aminolevulinate synthase [Sedimentitalea todarodis]|uniref:5-aminolevulinate synthase n=1 Tax=Sedimentitalea todarodis TaxID=1631240 RepID=A0ABU3VBV7_9RHOB|nr:5-aminolevulinate synthase [Sedimentitalea todarodis]MDU9003667.1 5-aminolevulinate synthase [Sedimentitalea todarodis]
MTAQINMTTTVILMALTASGYAIATLGMKLASYQLNALALVLMATGLAGAALAEITLLRQANLSVIYLGIIAVESLLVLSVAAVIGDRLTPVQLSGGAMVLVGMILVSQ